MGKLAPRVGEEGRQGEGEMVESERGAERGGERAGEACSQGALGTFGIFGFAQSLNFQNI